LDFALHSQEWKRRQHHNYFVTTSDAAEILQVPELCWVFSLIFVRNNSSFTDEGGGAGLWQLATTECGRSQYSSGTKVIEI